MGGRTTGPSTSLCSGSRRAGRPCLDPHVMRSLRTRLSGPPASDSSSPSRTWRPWQQDRWRPRRLRGYDIHLIVTARDCQADPFGVAAVRQGATPGQVPRLCRTTSQSRGLRRRALLATSGRPGHPRSLDASLPPDARVTVLTVPPSSADGRLLPARFFGMLGVDPGSTTPPPAGSTLHSDTSRQSCCAASTSPSVIAFPPAATEYRVAVRKVLRGPLLRSGSKAPTVPQTQVDALLAASQAMVDRLSAEGWTVLGDVASFWRRCPGPTPLHRPARAPRRCRGGACRVVR